ncbi:hypothetical protein [Microcoleus sp. EPA2]|uniref:hypothetical protein n=1 Tax=Microcoleus sp. EPA2 TaxID=2841654 RepID=UPI00312BA84A
MNYLILGLIGIPLLSVKVLAQHIGYPVAASVMIAANNAPEKAIDELTDSIFYNLYPQLDRRKIRSNETQYINEWAAIRKVLMGDGNLVYERGCGPSYWWHLSEYDTPGRNGREIIVFSPVLNKVADAVFYTRHPELGYRTIKPSETRLASEWSKIRQGVSLVHPCYY